MVVFKLKAGEIPLFPSVTKGERGDLVDRLSQVQSPERKSVIDSE